METPSCGKFPPNAVRLKPSSCRLWPGLLRGLGPDERAAALVQAMPEYLDRLLTETSVLPLRATTETLACGNLGRRPPRSSTGRRARPRSRRWARFWYGTPASRCGPTSGSGSGSGAETCRRRTAPRAASRPGRQLAEGRPARGNPRPARPHAARSPRRSAGWDTAPTCPCGHEGARVAMARA
jgi:hypothetical protein